MAALKCPNPACDFRFDPAQCPPGAVLACPKCQLRFSLDDAQAAAAVADPEPAPAAAPRRDDARRRPRSNPVGGVLAVGGVLVILTVVLVVVAVTLMGRRNGSDPAPAGGVPELRAADLNFSFRPPAGWDRDPVTQNALLVTALALKKADAPPAWVALSVVDYKTRAPRQEELRRKAHEHLARVFTGVDEQLDYKPAPLGGKPGERAAFRGEDKAGTRCAGEVHVLGYGGVGYWFFAWASEADGAAVAAAADDARAGFKVLDGRESWAAEATPLVVFRSVRNNSRFRLATADPAWKKDEGNDPAEHKPPAELLLKGSIKGSRDFRAEAFTAVYVVKAEGDARKQAEALVRAAHTPNAEAFGPSVVEPVPDDVKGQSAGADVPPGRPATRWQVRLTEEGASKSADKLVVFAHATVGPDLVIADAVCPLSQRPIWERRLVDLVGSVGPNE